MIRTLTQLDTDTAAKVLALPGACAEHDPRWLRVLEEGLGHRPYALLAESDLGNVRGYLPLALVQSALFGRFLVSLPYLNQAGILADSASTAQQLLDKAVELAERHNVQYLELRHASNVLDVETFTHRRDDKVLMILDLPPEDAQLDQQIGAKVRNQVRKGDKFDLVLHFGGRELLDRFYEVFSVNMRDLGTPVYPRKLFASILDQFSDEAELAVVTQHDRPLAVALLMHQGGQTQVPSASSLRSFSHTNANMWMYRRLLSRAIERGSVRFDFGRSSPDSGTHRFKKQWGALEHPTTWQYVLRRGELGAVRPDSPKMQRRINAWRKLPVWVTRLVGPAIVRGIP